MKQNLFKFLIATGTLVMITSFQNCSAPDHGGEVLLSGFDLKGFMEYPYTTKPEFFGDITLLKPTAQASNLASFKFLGNVTYLANRNAAISYTVTVKTLSGTVLCPTQTGSLAANSKITLIEFDCVTTNQSRDAKVDLVVVAAGKTQTFSEVYSE